MTGEPPLDRAQAFRAPLGVPGRDPRGRERAVGRGHTLHAGVPRRRGRQVRAAHLQQQVPQRVRQGQCHCQPGVHITAARLGGLALHQTPGI